MMPDREFSEAGFQGKPTACIMPFTQFPCHYKLNIKRGFIMKANEKKNAVDSVKQYENEQLINEIVNSFKLASTADSISVQQLVKCAIAIACYYSGSKNTTAVCDIFNKLFTINEKLVNKLSVFMNKLSSELDGDARVKRVEFSVLDIRKGILEDIDFKACWRIRKQFKEHEHLAVVRVKTAWAKVEKELDLDALKEQLRQMYRKCNSKQGKNALELALRDLGCTCPEK